MSAIKHIIRGCGTLPNYGAHPGTPALLMFVAMGICAGSRGGLIGALGGGAIMLAAFGPMYLCGAYSRSKGDQP